MFSPKGEKRVAGVIEKFTSLVDELEKGMQEMIVEKNRNDETINKLDVRNVVISDSITQASNVAAKLRDLVS